MRNLRKAMGIVELTGKYPADLVEASARQALAGSAFTRKAFIRLLEARQGELPIPISPKTQQLTRQADYFIHHPET